MVNGIPSMTSFQFLIMNSAHEIGNDSVWRKKRHKLRFTTIKLDIYESKSHTDYRSVSDAMKPEDD